VSGHKFQCKPLPREDYVTWDDLIEKSTKGTLFHHTYWLEAFGRPVAVIGCYQAEELIGGMSLSYQRVAGLKIARPPYLTPYLGPIVFRAGGKRHRALTLEKDVAASLIGYLTEHYDFARIPLSLDCVDVQPFQQRGFSVDVEYTYVIELDDMDRVWQELNQDRRRKIRRGVKEGLSCESSDDLDTFFRLWTRSLASHGKRLSQSRFGEVCHWYAALAAKNRAKLLLIKDAQGRIHAGAILVWDHRRAYYLLSGMDREIASGNAMALLLWECMRFSKEEAGVAEFDFDGSDVPGVEIFFRGFGGRLTPRFSVIWGRSYVWPIRQARRAVAALSGLSARALANFRKG